MQGKRIEYESSHKKTIVLKVFKDNSSLLLAARVVPWQRVHLRHGTTVAPRNIRIIFIGGIIALKIHKKRIKTQFPFFRGQASSL